ncbi:hypothetical protein JQC91_09965 [Jannaschia sp. Os4]|uniref:hypothetical protein n=1 Tax=Jannaschia sp. Os4 TaxID=2807617 RepID=UPI00193A2DAD|nr:hypothetical protein [Jannaschia sp. Os4]MBM2576629.1 hypothetical protein [Jannaschia sp. Os4]
MTKLMTALVATAALSAPAAAQVFGPTYGTDLDYDTFNTGFGETGYYTALDRDEDGLLSQSEYSTGLYADFDRDNDRLISADEFEMGYGRYMGTDTYDASMFDTYDADGDGMLMQSEFGTFYGEGYADTWATIDADADGFLSTDEYSTGLYNAADLDRDQVLTVEEEGFFEGWFDGDDITVEVQEIGDVYTDI